MAKGAVLRKVELSDPTVESVVSPPLRLDLGSGKTTPEGWIGIDTINFGQKWRCNLAKTPWEIFGDDAPSGANQVQTWVNQDEKRYGDLAGLKFFTLPDNSVDEARSSHFVEHLTGTERIAFFNELYRVMKNGATAQIVTPNWSHSCAYGDPTHQWPPMSQWYPLYLHKEWRAVNAPHVGYTCHFDHVIAGSWDGSIEGRNPETKSMMMNNYTNAWRDLIVTLSCRK